MTTPLKWTLFSTVLFLSVLAVYVIWTGDVGAGVLKTVASFAVVAGGALGLARLGRPPTAGR